MFDPGISRVLEGSLIDSPANAMLLTSELHDEFGKLRCYMQEVPGRVNTYVIKTTRGATPLSAGYGPRVQVTLANHEAAGTQAAELPLPRLLKLHAACCKMMEMAAAADYVETLLDDIEELMAEGTLAQDGSSDFGMLLRMKGLWGFESEVIEDGVPVC